MMDAPIQAPSVAVATPEPGVRTLTIDRPRRRNALDRATYRALGAALTAAAAADAVRVVVLTGAGGCFTSGNDLADFRDAEGSSAPADPAVLPASAWLDFLAVISTFPKPLVAAVEGFAIGIGTTMLLHCDLVHAARDVQFRLPFVPLGVCAEGGASYLLPLAAGPKFAAELLLLGRAFTAEEALRAGIANSVTDPGAALAAAMASARALAALPAESVQATKALLRRGTEAAVREAIDAEAVRFHALRGSRAAQDAFAAFFAQGKSGR